MDAFKPVNTTKPLWLLNVTELSAGFASQQFSPSDLCEQILERVETYNPTLNSYVFLNSNIRELARLSTERWKEGRPLSPLDGIPIAVKDNLNVASMPTAWGNPALLEHIPSKSERCIESCEDAGMIVIGKTNVPEFASDGVTYNPTFGHTRNPWDTNLTPGGSSGGTVSAVASAMAVCGIGTDGGGSIRRPSAHTGLVGLKPTAELISREHGLPRFMFDFEVAGPVARNVQDLAQLFQIMSGNIVSDSKLVRNSSENDSLNILVVNQIGLHPVEAEIVAANQAVARCLSKLGHTVVQSEFPINFDVFEKTWPIINQVGIAYIFDCFPLSEAVSQSKFQNMGKLGRQYSAIDMLKLWQQVLLFRQHVKDVFKQWDIILMPSIATTAWPIGKQHPETIAGNSVDNRGHAVFTGWVNMAGNPSLNFPAAIAQNGQPIGIQLIADWYQEQALLKVAQQLENMSGNWDWSVILSEMDTSING